MNARPPSASSSSTSRIPAAIAIDDLEGKVPTAAQVSLGLEVAWEMAGMTNYEKRSETERQRGANIPWARTDRDHGTKIALAGSAVLYKRDRREIKEGLFQELSHAQDSRNGVLCSKIKRLASGTWQSSTRLMRATYQKKFKALDIIDHMRYCRDKYCTDELAATPDSALLSRMMEIMRNSCADGAPDEQLAIRLSKEKGVWPNVDYFSRCSMHAAEGVITDVVKRSEKATEVLRVFVNGRAAGHDER